ncbi:MAG: 6-carboxytetrahydropterin synthase [Deltaproteobacteria bacterium]|nr:6-carboxytetrahydropterin synthase [Deltaproteobacteria bacterium]
MQEAFAIRVYKQYFNFGSAHFLIFADGSRERLHGHNYQVQVRLEGNLVAGDVVVDFIPFKPLVKRLCDAMDHRTLLPRDNAHLRVTEGDGVVEAVHDDGSRFVFPAADVLILPLPNISTEMLARHIAHAIVAALPEQVPEAEAHAIEVQVEESGGQSGICRLTL